MKNNTDIFSTCPYLMNICKERLFELTQDEYLKIKKFIDNNIDIIEYVFAYVFEYVFAPIINYFDLYKKCYNHYYCCSCYNYVFEHIEFREKNYKNIF